MVGVVGSSPIAPTNEFNAEARVRFAEYRNQRDPGHLLWLFVCLFVFNASLLCPLLRFLMDPSENTHSR